MSKVPSTAATRILRPRVYLNGGSRGFLVGLEPAEIVRLLSPTLVEVGIARE